MFDEMGAPWFRLWLDHKVEKPSPKGVEQGLAIDCLLTEGQAAFDARFSFSGPINPKTGKQYGRDTKASLEWEVENKKTLLDPDDELILADAVAAVRACSAWPAIEKSLPQVTIRRNSPALGFGLQSRPDWLHVQSATLFDLKKTRDLNRFGAQAIDLGYHLQAAVCKWCLGDDGIDLAGAFLVAVEWERGARCRVYEIPIDVLDYADRQMRKIAEEIARRFELGDWTDRQETAEALPIPAWIERKIEIGLQ
jgi:hypothetical protein